MHLASGVGLRDERMKSNCLNGTRAHKNIVVETLQISPVEVYREICYDCHQQEEHSVAFTRSPSREEREVLRIINLLERRSRDDD